MINSSVVLYLCIAAIIFLNNADGRNLVKGVAGAGINVRPTHHFEELLCSWEESHPATICPKVLGWKASAPRPARGDYCAKNITCDQMDGKPRVLPRKPLDRTPCDSENHIFACLGGLCVPAADKNFSDSCAMPGIDDKKRK